MKRLVRTLRGEKKEKTQEYNNSEEEEDDQKIHSVLPPEIMVLIFAAISEDGVGSLGAVRMVCASWNELCLDETLPFSALLKKKKEEVEFQKDNFTLSVLEGKYHKKIKTSTTHCTSNTIK